MTPDMAATPSNSGIRSRKSNRSESARGRRRSARRRWLPSRRRRPPPVAVFRPQQAARRARLRASAARAAASPNDDLLHDNAIAMDEDGDAGEPWHHGGAGPSHRAPSTMAGGEKTTAVVLFPARACSFFKPAPSNAAGGPPSSALPSFQTTTRSWAFATCPNTCVSRASEKAQRGAGTWPASKKTPCVRASPSLTTRRRSLTPSAAVDLTLLPCCAGASAMRRRGDKEEERRQGEPDLGLLIEVPSSKAAVLPPAEIMQHRAALILGASR